MAEYYFILTGIHKIWQSMTLLLLVSLRYGRVLHYYNWYPYDMAEYYFMLTRIPQVWQSITLL